MDGDNLKCSFCDKRQDQVEQLIVGPGGVAICTECVDLCNEIIADARAKRIHTAAGPGTASPRCVIALDGTITSLEGCGGNLPDQLERSSDGGRCDP